jgi:hypothetical protein
VHQPGGYFRQWFKDKPAAGKFWMRDHQAGGTNFPLIVQKQVKIDYPGPPFVLGRQASQVAFNVLKEGKQLFRSKSGR